MHAPTITIITVTYNAAALLEKTILSVLEQTYNNVEYIIIDGSSTDTTVECIIKYSDQLAYWESKHDKGIYHAMNKGVAKATGSWICFLNAGDVFDDKFVLERVVAAIPADKSAKILYGDVITLGKYGERNEKIASAPCNKHRMYFCHQSAFVSTNLLRTYPFDESYKMSADFKFFKESYYRGDGFAHMPFPIAIYDKSGISNTNRAAGIRENMDVIKEVDKGIVKCKFLLKLFFTLTVLQIRNRRKGDK
jgi:glycosyltransferase involved in cell wall biosynthesis